MTIEIIRDDGTRLKLYHGAELPERAPDLVIYDENDEKLEVWLDEKVEAFTTSYDGEETMLTFIDYIDGVWHYRSYGKGDWEPYSPEHADSSKFSGIGAEIENFIAETILLGTEKQEVSDAYGHSKEVHRTREEEGTLQELP